MKFGWIFDILKLFVQRLDIKNRVGNMLKLEAKVWRLKKTDC